MPTPAAFAKLHKRFLCQNHPLMVAELRRNGELQSYLTEIGEQAMEMYESLSQQMAHNPNLPTDYRKEGGGTRADTARGKRARDNRSDIPAPEVDADDEAARREPRTQNYRITAADDIGRGSPKEKVHANIAAISLLKQIEEERRPRAPSRKNAIRQTCQLGRGSGLPRRNGA
jgi:hypothetical protein